MGFGKKRKRRPLSGLKQNAPVDKNIDHLNLSGNAASKPRGILLSTCVDKHLSDRPRKAKKTVRFDDKPPSPPSPRVHGLLEQLEDSSVAEVAVPIRRADVEPPKSSAQETLFVNERGGGRPREIFNAALVLLHLRYGQSISITCPSLEGEPHTSMPKRIQHIGL